MQTSMEVYNYRHAFCPFCHSFKLEQCVRADKCRYILPEQLSLKRNQQVTVAYYKQADNTFFPTLTS